MNLTHEKLIYDIHYSYLRAGANIIATNTFNSTMTSQKDYDCQEYSFEINYAGAKIAKFNMSWILEGKEIDKYIK